MKPVLVIEGNTTILGNAGEILEPEGYKAISAANGKLVLHWLNKSNLT